MSFTFFRSNIIYFDQKRPIKVQIFWDFWVLRSKFVKFLISILKRQVNSSLDFPSFFSVITYKSSVNFKLIYLLLWAKGFHENRKLRSPSENFWDFRVLRSKFYKFIMSILNRQVNSSLNCVSFFMTHNSSVNFKLIYFIFLD